MPDDLNYKSIEQCMLDIMANTDAPFTVAESFADLVYSRDWTFDNGYDRRSVRFVQPGDNGILFEVSVHDKHEFGDLYIDPLYPEERLDRTLAKTLKESGLDVEEEDRA